jgi:hypothetical protein
MPKVAIIQLQRFREICSILPVAKLLHDQGNSVDFFTHQDHVNLLGACSYVNPMPLDCPAFITQRGIDAALKGKYDSIITSQVSQHFNPLLTDTNNWQIQQWARVGCLKDFHKLPLIFDNRETDWEQKQLNTHLPKSGKPLLLYCLQAKTHPFIYQDFGKWIENTFTDYNVFDVGSICLHKPQYLLAFLEKAKIVITVDNLLLQLGYATKTPTIALVPNLSYYQSEPRNHWSGKISYVDSQTDKAKQKIIALVNKPEMGKLTRDTALLRTTFVNASGLSNQRTAVPPSPVIKENRSNIIKLELPQKSAFNPSMVPFDNGYLVAYRYGDGHLVDVCRIDKDFKVVGPAINLKLPNPTDPRLFWAPGGEELLCFYSTGAGGNNEYIKVAKIVDLSESREIRVYNDLRVSPTSLKDRQKNWNPFIHDDKIYLIGQINPHEIWKMYRHNEKVEVRLVSSTDWESLWMIDSNSFRGNTNAVEVDEGMLCTFHSTEWVKNKVYYDNGVYLFDKNPPFKVLGCAIIPYLRAEDAITKHARSAHIVCTFPCSIIKDGDRVLVIYGCNDSASWVLDTTVDELMAMVKPIPTGDLE